MRVVTIFSRVFQRISEGLEAPGAEEVSRTPDLPITNQIYPTSWSVFYFY